MRLQACLPACLPACLALIFLAPSALRAQIGPVTGLPPFSTMQHLPEGLLNLGDLNLHIAIPVVAKAGRGPAFAYALTYDGDFLAPDGTTWIWPQYWGWYFTGPNAGTMQNPTQPATCSYMDPVTRTIKYENYTIYGPWTFTNANGVTLRFGGKTVDDPGGHCQTNNPDFTWETQGYTLTVTNYDDYVVTEPGGSQWEPYTFVDNNGNEISQNATLTAYTGTLGQQVLAISGSGTPTSPKVYTYAGPNGDDTVTGNYTGQLLTGNFNCPGIQNYSASNASMVTSIGLPDGSSYQFGYGSAGRLTSITLPTGGRITYTYSGGGAGTGINCADGSPAVLTRTGPDGTWTFQHALGSGGASTTTVTDPAGNVSTYTFFGDYEVERVVNQGASTLLEAVYSCYNSGAACTGPGGSFTLPITSRAVVVNENGWEKETVTDYDANQNPIEVDQYDWASGEPGALLRKTLIAYAALSGIQDDPASITIEDGSGNPVVSRIVWKRPEGGFLRG